MLDSQKGFESVGALNWQEFEELVSEVYRRQGYFVLENPREGADGGVDLRLRIDGKKIYVQCKHWKARQVGVKIVRELYGVMVDKNADEGVVVTYGTFTQDEGRNHQIIRSRIHRLHSLRRLPRPTF